MAYSEKTKTSISKNNLKLTADKVIQILDQVRDEGKKSRRRWIWELMQNAKDVKNTFGQVSIEIELSDDKLIFRHNGDPFRIDNLTGLIQQVSSKPSDGKDEETTGKFGTGFISTHLLSDVIIVKGVVQEPNENPKRIEIELNRSGETSEELMPAIEKALQLVDLIDDDTEYPPLLDYATKRTEADFDNEFIYSLLNEEAKQAAKVGVEDLKTTLPLTLAFIDKLKQVRVINHLDVEDITYRCEKKSDANQIREFEIQINKDSKRVFVLYSNDNYSLAVEVNDLKEYKLIETLPNQPYLYRDFPLVGTDNFYFPFILNGRNLYPTEKRDSILLNGQKKKPEHNKTVFAEAIEGSKKFIEYLILKNALNRYVALLSRFPSYDFEEDTREWFLNDIQTNYRKHLLTLPVIETELGTSILSTVKFPRCGLDDKDNIQFWNLCAAVLGYDNLPKQEIFLASLKNIGPKDEEKSWNEKLYFTFEDLFELIQSKKTLEGLDLHSPNEAEKIDKTKWLKEVFAFAISQKQSDLFEKFEVVPNQNGTLRKLDELFEEDIEKPIPDEFLDVLKLLGKDWRADLIYRGVDFSILNHAKRGMSDIAEAINEILNEEKKVNNVAHKVFLKREDALNHLVSILKIDSPDSTKIAFRHKLFYFAKDLFHFTDDLIQVNNSSKFNYNPAIKLLLSIINEAIENCKTVEVLKTTLQNKEPIDWLNNYLHFIAKNEELKYFLDEGNIVPNRENLLCAYEDLFNYGTQEQALDDNLIAILQKFDPKKTWQNVLLSDGITLTLPNTKTFDELANEIMAEVNRVKGEESYETYREALLELIDWCASEPKLTPRYLSGFQEISNRIFFILTIENSSIGSDVIKMLKNKDNLEVLASISDANIDIAIIKELINISGKIGGMEDILEHARELLSDKLHFDYMQQIGENVELVFKEALLQEGINADIIHQGWGSHDFEVRNPINNKSMFIELKSFASGSTEPFKLAISQARKAIDMPEKFALCVLERPTQTELVVPDFIRSELKYRKGISPSLQTAVADNSNFERIRNSQDNVHLYINLREDVRVSVGHNFVTSNCNTFSDLINDIKIQLGN
jgi:hypothetical protein